MPMRGLHLTADLYRCRCPSGWLTGAQQVGDWCREAAESAGLAVAGELFQPQQPQGVAGMLLMQDAHLNLHTWPAERGVTLDVYVAQAGQDRAAQAVGLVTALVDHFQPEWTEQRSMDRGDGDA
jgi:S-adenosylmethionine decarboxylase